MGVGASMLCSWNRILLICAPDEYAADTDVHEPNE